MRHRPLQALGLLLGAGLLAGCAAAPAGSTAPETGTTAPSQAASRSAGASAGPSAGSSVTATTKPASATKPTVDLVFTGAVAVSAKGVAGMCTIGKSAAGQPVAFGFGATKADFPGLADG